MFAHYLKEYESREEKYLKIDLNEHFVMFKIYFNSNQVNYHLFKRKIFATNKEPIYPTEKLVDDFDIEFENTMPVAYAAFIFGENESVLLGSIDVDENFRRNYIALFMLKYFLQDYYPYNEYTIIKAEARTEESKKMMQKIGLEKERVNGEFGYWFMALQPPKKITFPKECCLEIITNKTVAASPSPLKSNTT